MFCLLFLWLFPLVNCLLKWNTPVIEIQSGSSQLKLTSWGFFHYWAPFITSDGDEWCPRKFPQRLQQSNTQRCSISCNVRQWKALNADIWEAAHANVKQLIDYQRNKAASQLLFLTVLSRLPVSLNWAVSNSQSALRWCLQDTSCFLSDCTQMQITVHLCAKLASTSWMWEAE